MKNLNNIDTENLKYKYIFPNPMAKMMAKVDDKTNFEASMMSMALLLIGMILMGVYSLIYLDQSWIFRSLVVLNLIAGFIFMYSFLITTYQQYLSYMDAMEIQGIKPQSVANIPHKKNRKNQALFFGGLFFILVGGLFYFIKDSLKSKILSASLSASILPYDSYIAIGLGVLGLIMIALVFKKKKNNLAIPPKIREANMKATKVKEVAREATPAASSYNPNIKELAEEIRAGLDSLKSIPDNKDNEVLRKMISIEIKSKVALLKQMKGGITPNGR